MTSFGATIAARVLLVVAITGKALRTDLSHVIQVYIHSKKDDNTDDAPQQDTAKDAVRSKDPNTSKKRNIDQRR
jgi:hypothetical protein